VLYPCRVDEAACGHSATLSEADLIALRGINEKVSLDEVVAIYLPLSRLLNLHVAATQSLHAATDAFLWTPVAKVPYIIGIAGSVAVGKSTTCPPCAGSAGPLAQSPQG
jgi:pantothenate kinase